jgi:hypothetical protein
MTKTTTTGFRFGPVQSFVSACVFAETPSGIFAISTMGIFDAASGALLDLWWSVQCGADELSMARGVSDVERDAFVAAPQPEVLCGNYYAVVDPAQGAALPPASAAPPPRPPPPQAPGQALPVDAVPGSSLRPVCALVHGTDPTPAQAALALVKLCVSPFARQHDNDDAGETVAVAGSQPSAAAMPVECASFLRHVRARYFAPVRDTIASGCFAEPDGDHRSAASGAPPSPSPSPPAPPPRRLVRAQEVMTSLQTPKGTWSCASGFFKVTSASACAAAQHAESTFAGFVARNWARGVSALLVGGVFPVGALTELGRGFRP